MSQPEPVDDEVRRDVRRHKFWRQAVLLPLLPQPIRYHSHHKGEGRRQVDRCALQWFGAPTALRRHHVRLNICEHRTCIAGAHSRKAAHKQC